MLEFSFATLSDLIMLIPYFFKYLENLFSNISLRLLADIRAFSSKAKQFISMSLYYPSHSLLLIYFLIEF
jgi:hypothetical protein